MAKKSKNTNKTMKDYEMLESQNLGFGTLLTVVNYDKYQIGPDSDGHSDGHTDEDTSGHSDGHSDGTRSKTIDIRLQTEDSKSASAEQPPARMAEPSIGSPEWYKLHYDD